MAKQSKKIEAPANTSIGREMEAKAVKLGAKLNDALMSEIDRLNTAKQDWEGGAFVVMFRLTAMMTKEEKAELPDPKEDSGNNPAIYKVAVKRISDKGKVTETWKELNYYKELVLNMPGITAKSQLKDQIERSLGDSEKVNKDGIPSHILDWSVDYRRAMIKKLQNEINGAVSAVTAAFGLYFQLKAFNQNLSHVAATPVWAIGPDGKPMDGQDGRGYKVEATTNPIIIRTTVRERDQIDVKMVGISQFLKYDVKKIVELGGTYAAVEETAKRAKPTETQGAAGGTGNAQDQSRPIAINTPDTANARAMDLYEYLTRSLEATNNADWQSMQRSLNSKDSDVDFLAWRGLLRIANMLVGSPKDDTRHKALLKEMADSEAA